MRCLHRVNVETVVSETQSNDAKHAGPSSMCHHTLVCLRSLFFITPTVKPRILHYGECVESVKDVNIC